MSSARKTFFRQSGWMILATVLSGGLMMSVNLVANRMVSSEFVIFRQLLTVFLLMSFPTAGLQVVFAEQASRAATEEDRRRLAGTVRSVLRGAFCVWLAMAATIFAFRRTIIDTLGISNPAALWLTLLVGLSSLWLPVLRGLLQGTQNFIVFGLVAVLDGAGRLTATVLIVGMGGQAAGGMAGACVGQAMALALGFWSVRAALRGAGGQIDWRAWFGRVTPLTLAFSAILFTSCFDLIYVGIVFPGSDTAPYVGAQVIGLALMMLTTPVAMVMFPKIVASAAHAGRSDAFRLAFGMSALVTGVGALACALWPGLPVRILFFRKPEFWPAAALVPWFAWALAPLILANVLVNNLMARGRLGIAPWLALTALGYGVALFVLRGWLPKMETFAAFKLVIGTLGVFSSTMLLVALIFMRRERATGWK
jgi:O-antigen/teichoic acid export membrane protein